MMKGGLKMILTRIYVKRIFGSLFLISLFLFGIFLNAEQEEKYKKLQAEIQEKGYSFTVGRTSVSDIPLEKLCGLKEPKDWRDKGKFDGFLKEKIGALPSSFDWRQYGCVTPPKNQNPCGTCWAFATIGSYEGAIACVYGGPSVDLAEQFLVDCNTHGKNCNSGGWFDFDDMYGGTPYESCYPYACPALNCTGQACRTGCQKHFPEYDWYYVGSRSAVPDIDTLKAAIYTHGPIAAAVYANSYWSSYTGGVFNACGCQGVNHGIVLVGWNDADGGYWILKNSWGPNWGENGYMKIRYNCCNVGFGACYAVSMIGESRTR